ncbi:hypothetical protein POKO110462_12160 [Pontibacter korlensis]
MKEIYHYSFTSKYLLTAIKSLWIKFDNSALRAARKAFS